MDLIIVFLLVIHFGIPAIYFTYMYLIWFRRNWDLNTPDILLNYPFISIIIPTYNEEKMIGKKLENIYEQKYPRDKLEVIVIDSASTDLTPHIVYQWMNKHRNIKAKLIIENRREGKAKALNHALENISENSEIIIVTDADALWPRRDTLLNVVKWLSNPKIGAVSCIKIPQVVSSLNNISFKTEKQYRRFYNILRIAESKAYSTPISHGELLACKVSLIKQIGGFPTHIGADDSYISTQMALNGFRSIIPDNIICIEYVPRKKYFLWKIRRAQHLIQLFFQILNSIFSRKISKELRKFKFILAFETYLHIFNPLILVSAIVLIFISIILFHSIFSLSLLLLGIILLIYKPYNTWITYQFLLLIAMFKNIRTSSLIWEKINK